jgi:hypothetical protein
MCGRGGIKPDSQAWLLRYGHFRFTSAILYCFSDIEVAVSHMSEIINLFLPMGEPQASTHRLRFGISQLPHQMPEKSY